MFMEKLNEPVKFKLFGTLRLTYRPSEGEIEIDSSLKLKDLIKELDKRYPGVYEKLVNQERLRPGVVILKNGKNVLHLEGLETEIVPGDTVVIFPPGAGG